MDLDLRVFSVGQSTLTRLLCTPKSLINQAANLHAKKFTSMHCTPSFITKSVSQPIFIPSIFWWGGGGGREKTLGMRMNRYAEKL